MNVLTKEQRCENIKSIKSNDAKIEELLEKVS